MWLYMDFQFLHNDARRRRINKIRVVEDMDKDKGGDEHGDRAKDPKKKWESGIETSSTHRIEYGGTL